MCLTVQKIVKRNVVKCFKQLIFGYQGKVKTPYQNILVYFDGILVPEYNTGKILDKSDLNLKIEGGYIHAYTTHYGKVNTELSCGRNYLEAYAINTLAYGINDDLICYMLYIPLLDLSDLKKKRLALLNKKGVRKQELAKVFISHKDYILNPENVWTYLS